MLMAIKVVQFGLGPIGLACVKAVCMKSSLELVGAIDIDPKKVDKDVGELLEDRPKVGVTVSSNAEKILKETRPDVVLHTTRSFVPQVFPQLELIVKHKAHVVSSTEELLFPRLKHPELAQRLDQLAQENGVTILGTGVNPGFVMDTLPLVMSSVCTEVRSIRVERFVDASTRRLPLQKKVGAGLDPEEFRRLVGEGKLGHVGMKESVALIAHALQWSLDTIEETIEPVIAEEAHKTPYLEVPEGKVAGIKDVGRGIRNGEEVITLDLRMYVGAKDPHDAIFIDGTPPIRLTITGGVMGDIATAAMLVNSIPRVLEASPGLKTMADLPIPRQLSN